MLVNIVITYLMNAVMSQVWSAANILQIIAFMSVIKMKFPSSSVELFEMILGLVTFDIIPEEFYEPIRDSIFTLPSDIFYYQQIQDAGIQTGYILIESFMTFVLLGVMILGFIMHFCIYHWTSGNSKP